MQDPAHSQIPDDFEKLGEETPSGDDVQTDDDDASAPPSEQESTRIPFVTALRSNLWYAEVSSILHWHEPVQSAILFVIGNLFFFLITVGEYSVLTLTSYLALSLVLVCCVYANATMLRAYWKKENVVNPFSAKLKNPWYMSNDSLEPHAESIIGVVNDFLRLTRAILYSGDYLLSLKAAVFLWFLAIIGSWFSGMTLLYMSFLAAFVWPRIYSEKQVQIDHVYNLVCDKVHHHVTSVLSRIPVQKKKKTE